MAGIGIIAADRAGLVAIADALDVRGLEYERQRDSRCVFTFTYALLTRRIAEGFGDPVDIDWDWIGLLAVAFARRYTIALDASDQGAVPPPAWAHVFGTLRTSRTSVLEDLLFPMTVHIVRDLPHALVDIGLEADGRRHLREFHHVNELMDDAIGDIKNLLHRRYGPFTAWLDRFGGGVDDILTDYGIRTSRATAWYNANRLVNPPTAVDAQSSIERSPRILVELVMNPQLWTLDLALRALRFVAAITRRWPGPNAKPPRLAPRTR